jgi:hypothetical protein
MSIDINDLGIYDSKPLFIVITAHFVKALGIKNE